jgi:hypothetical protein
MTAAAPRLHPQLVERLERLARSQATVADIRRALVVLARELNVPPPSYEHVRRLVLRRRQEIEVASESAVVPDVLKVAVGAEHGNELLRVARGGRRRRTS